mmetsp:Transcript_5610/g.7108  ORF Transcript_5610/g.7108 Transcript_5610/m.7108 type:complete len:180 (-) Transcript_5610:1114-1653(-)
MEDSFLPARPIVRLLKETGIDDWHPRVIYQLLEFQHSVIEELLDDAKEFAYHRGKHALSERDVKLAIRARNLKIPKSKPTPFRLGLRKPAVHVRSQPLPHIQPTEKVRLPKTGALIKNNFRITDQETNNKETEDSATKPQPVAMEVDTGKEKDDLNLASSKYNVKSSKKKIEMVVPSSM